MDHKILLKAFRNFLQSHESSLSEGVNITSSEIIFNEYIIPMIDKGVELQLESDHELELFAGKIFTLSMYNKFHSVESWEYQPKVTNGSHIDFLVNERDYIEVYNPVINKPGKGLEQFLEVDDKGKFYRKEIDQSIKKMSEIYKDIPVIFIIGVVTGDFVKDTIYTLSKVGLSSINHQIIYYHGDTEYVIDNKYS